MLLVVDDSSSLFFFLTLLFFASELTVTVGAEEGLSAPTLRGLGVSSEEAAGLGLYSTLLLAEDHLPRPSGRASSSRRSMVAVSPRTTHFIIALPPEMDKICAQE